MSSRGILSAVRKAIKEHRKIGKEINDGKPLNTRLGVGPQIPEEEQEKMGPEDCIALLQAICESRPDVVVSRDWFRKNSGIADSTWTQYFGKFNHFKQAANVKIDRRANKLLLQVSRHSAADDLRRLNELRRSYDGKYEKPTGGRWRTMLVHFDVHDTEADAFCIRVLLDVARRLGRTITDVVNGGDLYDAPEFGRYLVDPREWDPVRRFRWVQDEYLKPLREALPDAAFWLIEGNHEMRVNALLSAATPAVKVVLSDFHGFTIPEFFGLDKYEVNYISKADLAAVDYGDAATKKELRRNFKVFYETYLVHHFKEGQRKGMPGGHGHSHRYEVWSHESPQFGAYNWTQYGCVHGRHAAYMDGETFQNGFALVHIDTQTRSHVVEYVEVGQTQCIAAGKFYIREKDEY